MRHIVSSFTLCFLILFFNIFMHQLLFALLLAAKHAAVIAKLYNCIQYSFIVYNYTIKVNDNSITKSIFIDCI